MSTHNRADFLREALGAMFRLDPPAHEIVVIDDGSTDHTGDVLAEFSSKVVYERRSNGGKSSAVNRAVDLARGEWIWICDDDDLVDEGAIYAFADGVKADPFAGFVYTACGWLMRNSAGTFERKLPPVLELPPSNEVWGYLLAGLWIPSLCPLIIRRKVFIELGGLRESFRRVEDEDFALRMLRVTHGTPVPVVTYLVRQHPGVRGAGGFRFSNSERENVDLASLRAIYSDVYATYRLSEYQVPNDGMSRLLSDPVLMRMLTMFRVCLWDLAAEDYRLREDVVLSDRERAKLEHLLCTTISGFALTKLSDLLRSSLYAMIMQSPRRDLHKAFRRAWAKGLYWAIIAELRRGNLRASMNRAAILLRTIFEYYFEIHLPKYPRRQNGGCPGRADKPRGDD